MALLLAEHVISYYYIVIVERRHIINIVDILGGSTALALRYILLHCYMLLVVEEHDFYLMVSSVLILHCLHLSLFHYVATIIIITGGDIHCCYAIGCHYIGHY